VFLYQNLSIYAPFRAHKTIYKNFVFFPETQNLEASEGCLRYILGRSVKIAETLENTGFFTKKRQKIY